MRLPLFSILASLALGGLAPTLVFAQAAALPQGSAHFTLIQANDGKTVGSADCTVAAVLGGYQIDSHGDMKLAKFSYTFSNSNRLDPRLNIVRDQLSGTVNGTQVTFSLTSDATGRQFQVNIVSAGKTTTNSFDRHQHTVLMPDLDPAAYVAMAHFALEHPPTAWIVIPKQNGILVPAEYDPQPDVRGTRDGHSMLVHHTSVIVSAENAISAEIFYGGDGALLEADLPEQNFYVIRDGFKLENRPHYTPPRASAPPPDQQQGPGQYPQQQPYPQQPQQPYPPQQPNPPQQ